MINCIKKRASPYRSKKHMNDELNYLKMIEIPVCSTEVISMPAKKKKKSLLSLKRELMNKVNREQDSTVEEKEKTENVETVADSEANSKQKPEQNSSVVVERKKTEKRAKPQFNIVMAQLAVICVLVATIITTSIFWKDSGINTLVRSVFSTGAKSEATDTRAYSSFKPELPSKVYDVAVTNGVMCFTGTGAIYAVCDGTISSVTEKDGKYDIVIRHSDYFKSIISGVDYAYFAKGDTVYQSLPVCYSLGEEVKVYLYDNNELLKNYTVSDGSIVWQS